MGMIPEQGRNLRAAETPRTLRGKAENCLASTDRFTANTAGIRRFPVAAISLRKNQTPPGAT